MKRDRRLVFDLETNGLPSHPWNPKKEPLDRIHCGVIYDLDLKKSFRFTQVAPLLGALSRAKLLVGHNITGFDLHVLKSLHGWEPHHSVDLIDTQVVANMAYQKRRLFRLIDEAKQKHGEPDKSLYLYGHSLEFWGWVIGEAKGSFSKSTDWKTFSPEMLDYCEQDVKVNVRLLNWLTKNSGYSEESMILESNFADLMFRQRLNGVGFDREKALILDGKLREERDPIADELRELFPAWWGPAGKQTTPRKSMRKKNKITGGINSVEEGCEYQNLKLIELNPSSRHHIARCLTQKYGWKPKVFNKKDGSAKCDRKTLKGLPYPEAQLFAKYEELNKKLGLVSNGDKSWLKYEKNGKIHGKVDGNGTGTGRCSHSSPNQGQVPKVGKPYGKDCRECFVPTRPNWVMVGCDASGLELRMLAHYMGRWDGGAMKDVVLDGDVHGTWQEATGLFYRDNQKTGSYAYLYGAMDPRLGETVILDWRQAFEEGVTEKKPPSVDKKSTSILGKKFRERLQSRVVGLGDLQDLLEKKMDANGYVMNLDGRRIYFDSKHSRLNYLLQGSGAIVMKKAAIILDRGLKGEGLKEGEDFAWMLNVHDEFQLECPGHLADFISKMAEESIALAGEYFKLRCPLAGEAKVGASWAETH